MCDKRRHPRSISVPRTNKRLFCPAFMTSLWHVRKRDRRGNIHKSFINCFQKVITCLSVNVRKFTLWISGKLCLQTWWTKLFYWIFAQKIINWQFSILWYWKYVIVTRKKTWQTRKHPQIDTAEMRNVNKKLKTESDIRIFKDCDSTVGELCNTVQWIRFVNLLGFRARWNKKSCKMHVHLLDSNIFTIIDLVPMMPNPRITLLPYSNIQENLTINFYVTNDKNWKVMFNSCNKYGELYCWLFVDVIYFVVMLLNKHKSFIYF
jgi:hypothetical protein